MGFTELSAGGAGSLVMDAAFFAQALPLNYGLYSGLNGAPSYQVDIDDPYGSYVSVGPYPTLDPPFEPGVAAVPGVGTVVVRGSFFPSTGPDGTTWQVNYFTLEPGAAAEVQALQLFPQGPGAGFGIVFQYLPGQTSGILHLNDCAPIAATVGSVYDREAANSIRGYDSPDLLLGFGGDDTIRGEGGADSIDGGDGNDLLSAIEFFSSGFPDGYVDSLNGGAGNDTLYGDDDADLLLGDVGNDLLIDYDGADSLNGGKGNDTLKGGDRADLLTGGAGRDWFVFGSPGMFSKGDKIKDFNPTDDQIVIDLNFFDSSYTAGMDLGATGHFVANVKGKATSPAGVSQFVYDTDSGKLTFDQDGAGGLKGLLVATFTNLPVLTAADFTVIG